MDAGILTRRRQRVGFIALMAAIGALGPLALDMYLPAFTSIAASLDAPVSDIQLTLSACLLGLGLGQVVYGPLSDRFGRKRPLLVGVGVFIVASVGCALAPSLPILVGLRFVQALGACAGLVMSRAIVRDLYVGNDMARVLSIIMTVFGIAPVLAPSIGAAILSIGSWPWVFVALGGIGALTLVGVLWLPETHAPELRVGTSPREVARTYSQLARQRDFVVPAAVAALGAMTLFTYIVSAPALFVDGYGFSPNAFALTFGGMAIAVAAMAQVNARLVRRFTLHTLLQGFLTVQVVSLVILIALLTMEAPAGLIMPPLAVAASSSAAIMSNAVAEAMVSFPQRAGSASALVGTAQMTGGAAMSAVVSWLAFSVGLEMSVAMLAAAATSLGLVLAHRRRLDARSTLRVTGASGS